MPVQKAVILIKKRIYPMILSIREFLLFGFYFTLLNYSFVRIIISLKNNKHKIIAWILVSFIDIIYIYAWFYINFIWYKKS